MSADAGNDVIQGRAGNDIISGGAGTADKCFGEAGLDIIIAREPGVQ